jgi:hypothetical protein
MINFGRKGGGGAVPPPFHLNPPQSKNDFLGAYKISKIQELLEPLLLTLKATLRPQGLRPPASSSVALPNFYSWICPCSHCNFQKCSMLCQNPVGKGAVEAHAQHFSKEMHLCLDPPPGIAPTTRKRHTRKVYVVVKCKKCPPP